MPTPPCSMVATERVRISISRTPDLDGLGQRWRAVEAEAETSATIFRSWTWVGADAATRYTDPFLIEANDGDRTVGLALFNRTRGLPPRLHLSESGNPDIDRVFIEHNGPLLARDAPPGTLAAMLRPLRGRAATLSGIDTRTLDAASDAGLAPRVAQTRIAPVADLRRGPFLDGLSANTRQQLRRSARLFEQAAGAPLSIALARDVSTATEWLDALAGLHQRTWQARGKPGAFADASFVRFHRALIAAGLPRGQVEMLRISAGDTVIGYLYNLRSGNRVHAYQSGFAYGDDPRRKPGLTCHHVAIERAQAEGVAVYDFLAGDDRYKQSLANDAAPLHWVTIDPIWSPVALARRVKDAARRIVAPRPGRSAGEHSQPT
jgi:CelD/BcsL family acetyltransferase involved in cellulose biosynthesis